MLAFTSPPSAPKPPPSPLPSVTNPRGRWTRPCARTCRNETDVCLCVARVYLHKRGARGGFGVWKAKRASERARLPGSGPSWTPSHRFIPFRVPRCHRQRALRLTRNDTPPRRGRTTPPRHPSSTPAANTYRSLGYLLAPPLQSESGDRLLPG